MEQVIHGLLSVAYHIHQIGQINLAQLAQNQLFALGLSSTTEWTC
jgi:hypothetical protein